MSAFFYEVTDSEEENDENNDELIVVAAVVVVILLVAGLAGVTVAVGIVVYRYEHWLRGTQDWTGC